MKKLWWRIRLFILMTWYGYVPRRRWMFLKTWKWVCEDDWTEYFEDTYTPLETLKEVWSYS